MSYSRLGGRQGRLPLAASDDADSRGAAAAWGDDELVPIAIEDLPPRKPLMADNSVKATPTSPAKDARIGAAFPSTSAATASAVNTVPWVGTAAEALQLLSSMVQEQQQPGQQQQQQQQRLPQPEQQLQQQQQALTLTELMLQQAGTQLPALTAGGGGGGGGRAGLVWQGPQLPLTAGIFNGGAMGGGLGGSGGSLIGNGGGLGGGGGLGSGLGGGNLWWRVLGGQDADTDRAAAGSDGGGGAGQQQQQQQPYQYQWRGMLQSAAVQQQQQQQQQQQLLLMSKPESVAQLGQQTPTVPPPPQRQQATGTAAAVNPMLDPSSYRILGGNDADQNRYRFIASLRDLNGRHFCGGSLLAPSVVLTAAHCLQSASDGSLRTPTVHIGRYYTETSDQQGHDVRKCVTSVVHPGWSFTRGQNDLALCFLDSPSSRPTMMLVPGNLRLYAQTSLVVVGFGAKQEGGGNYDTLQEAVVYPQDVKACNSTYGGLIGSSQICAGRAAGGVDACQGDSGGPLLLPRGTPATVFSASPAAAEAVAPDGSETDLQLGVVSWGRGCGQRGQPGVYTDLAKYRDWIDEQIKANQKPPLPVASFPSPDQIRAAVESQYKCTTTPSGDDLRAAAQTVNKGDPLAAALEPYGCKPKSDTAAADPAPAPAPAPAPTPAPVARNPDPCSCSTDGRSGTAVTSLVGCAQHGLSNGDTLFYCMVAGGTANCSSATPSVVYDGAAWMSCTPNGRSGRGGGGGRGTPVRPGRGGGVAPAVPPPPAAPPVAAFDESNGGQGGADSTAAGR
ncbi:hypothetical protein PLESTB_001312200 [Pleodorina starrii]|uniref:Peptidase S1 domain-containing protein n=1 Tax=Pleodorina starrii TaxID=330485 RepID=A0A9W6F698_9CHLO|nr:hypothetical protein PLESTM_000961200 [Pleodorina starrii]GLC58047.1 hypothetical protein PLESTB_001312200 [Pleodorina starrii]